MILIHNNCLIIKIINIFDLLDYLSEFHLSLDFLTTNKIFLLLLIIVKYFYHIGISIIAIANYA